MKKILVVCAAMTLSCLLVHAQEADNSGTGVGLSVIPRLDLSPEFSDGKGDFTLGNSSFYTLLEGDLSESFSFSIANHWLSFPAVKGPFFQETGDLYKHTWRSDWTNWLDWAYLTWSAGSFSVTLGKDMISIGGIEFDDYDFETHPALNSSLWNDLSCYQWGGKVSWTNDSENTSLGLQVLSSPFSEKPFGGGLLSYSLDWRGSYGAFENIWSVSMIEREKGDFIPAISLGQRYELDFATLGLDVFSVIGDPEEMMVKGLTVMPSVLVPLGDKFELGGKLIGEINGDSKDKDLGAGVNFHWFPLEGSRDLRAHAIASWRHDAKLFTFGAGVLYNINLNLGRKK